MADRNDRPRIHRTRGARRRRRLRIALFSAIGVIVLILALAGGSYLWFSKTVEPVNQRINETHPDAVAALEEAPPTTLVPIKESEQAIDIMLVGNDSRSDDPTSGGRSDTLMLVHVDPENDYLSILSIPRDMYVSIPGHGKNKINAAYAYGGPALSIKTIKAVTGINVKKYAEVGFETFSQLVDSLGGVYVDIDRQYTRATRDMDIHPGYQLLSGTDALLFARFRYDSNSDFGRQRRQQRVLAALREQAAGWNLTTKLPSIISTMMDGMATNLTAGDFLKLAKFVVGLDGSRIRQLFLTGTTPTIDGKSVVLVPTSELKEVVTQFLTPPEENASTTSSSETGSSETGTSQAGTSTTTSTTGSAAAVQLVAATSTSLTATSGGTIKDAAMWKGLQKSISFKLQAPTYVPDGYSYSNTYPTGGRTYGIETGDGKEPCVRVMYRYGARDLYIGISATTWTDPPLATKGTEVEKNGVVYHVVGSNSRTDHIWWTSGDVLYFISNTLMYSAKPDVLLKMAESMVPVSQ